MKSQVQQLRDLMKEHGLTRPRVAELCGVAKVTVDAWLAPADSALHNKLLPRHLILLKLSLQYPGVRQRAG